MNLKDQISKVYHGTISLKLKVYRHEQYFQRNCMLAQGLKEHVNQYTDKIAER